MNSTRMRSATKHYIHRTSAFQVRNNFHMTTITNNQINLAYKMVPRIVNSPRRLARAVDRAVHVLYRLRHTDTPVCQRCSRDRSRSGTKNYLYVQISMVSVHHSGRAAGRPSLHPPNLLSYVDEIQTKLMQQLVCRVSVAPPVGDLTD